MRGLRVIVVSMVVGLLGAPALVSAQASIAGQVKDASGAVLPGVTVEASSTALIEKVRSVVTGGTGQYRIELLPPGTYTVTFALPGFSTVKRDGIELTSSFTATVNVEMRVGTLEETMTVSGEQPASISTDATSPAPTRSSSRLVARLPDWTIICRASPRNGRVLPRAAQVSSSWSSSGSRENGEPSAAEANSLWTGTCASRSISPRSCRR